MKEQTELFQNACRKYELLTFMTACFLRQYVGTVKVVSCSAKVFLMQVKKKKKDYHKIEVPIKAS